MIESLESRQLLSVTISTPPGPDSIELQDAGGALVITIDDRATYRLHSDVTILASGGDSITLDGTISEAVDVVTQAGDTTTIIESTDNSLTLDGMGNVVITIGDSAVPVPAMALRHHELRPDYAPPPRTMPATRPATRP